MVNRSIKLILKGFVWMILASSLGCGYGLKRVNVQRVEGTLECFESIDARLLRTNRFTIVFGSGSVFLQIRGDDGNLVSQSVVDEYDYGRWWRAESTNGQDSAWIRAKNDKSNNLVPLDFQGELILMPLFWTSNSITKNLTAAVDSLRDSQIFSVIREEIIANRMGGPYIQETRNLGIIVSREISSSYSNKPEDIDFKTVLFEVKYLTNNLVYNHSIPSQILINDYRLGKVFPPTRYKLFIEALSVTNFYPQNLYPEVSGSKYMLTDNRTGFISQRDQKPWPARHTSEFKMATRSRLIITSFLICFTFVSFALIIFSVNKNKNKITNFAWILFCLGQTVITTLGSQYHSSSDPQGPNQTNDADPKSVQVESKAKDCSSGYVSVAQSISERQWCIKNCANCAKLENGTHKAPDSNPKPCDCVAGNKHNERSRVGTKVTMTGGFCIYLSADYEGSVKGKVDLELLKKGIAKLAGLIGGGASIELGIVADLSVGGTVSVPFTYSKTSWAGEALPALNCSL